MRAALRRLESEGIVAKLYCEGFGRVATRVEAIVAGPASTARTEEVREAVRYAAGDPFLRVSVRFDGRAP